MSSSCCACCGSSPDTQLLCCRGCRAAKYCSAKCQVAHWKAHRPVCLAAHVDRARQLASIDSELAQLMEGLPGGTPSPAKCKILIQMPATDWMYQDIEFSCTQPSLPAAVAAKVLVLAQRALALKDEPRAYRLFQLAGSPPDPSQLLDDCGGGDSEAQFQAAQMLLRRGGRGTDLEGDRSRLCVAALWLRYAASQGHQAAAVELCCLNAAPSQPSDPRMLHLLLHLRRSGLLTGSTQPTAAEAAVANEFSATIMRTVFQGGVAEVGPLEEARTQSERRAEAEERAARTAAKEAAKAKAEARALEQARAREEAKAERAKQRGK